MGSEMVGRTKTKGCYKGWDGRQGYGDVVLGGAIGVEW